MSDRRRRISSHNPPPRREPPAGPGGPARHGAPGSRPPTRGHGPYGGGRRPSASRPRSAGAGPPAWLSVVTVLVLAGSALVTWLGRPPEPDLMAPPAPLLGTWVTDDERYADRALEIGPDAVTYHTGRGGRSVHEVNGVFVDREQTPPHYTIDFGSEERGTDGHITLWVDGADLLMENRPLTRWTRAPERDP